MNTQQQRDDRIQEIHAETNRLWPKIESMIDELKVLGSHSKDGDNALLNVRNWLRDLSQR